MGLLAAVRREWFIIGIVLVILSAKLQPSVGVRGGERRRSVRGGTDEFSPLFSPRSVRANRGTRPVTLTLLRVFISGLRTNPRPLLHFRHTANFST